MPASDVFKAGSTAIITGGASGIGLSLVKLCHGKGMNVIAADRDAMALADLKDKLSGDTNHVTQYTMDVSIPADWDGLKDFVIGMYGSIELLVLNAGMTKKSTWGDGSYFRQVIETNLFGVIHGINYMLPVVQAASNKNPTSIIITGSKQGITNPPGNPAYNASKAAVKSLAEQLSYDLRRTSTSVHLLVPGWTYTGMTGISEYGKPPGAWEPEQVVEYLYGLMEQDKFWVICPDNDVTPLMDNQRIAWSTGDITTNRMPLSRWREETRDEARQTMDSMKMV